MPFIPWQASFQMPLTLYAPFCNAYQLAQLQQGPVAGVTNFQGLGIPGQLQQSPTNTLMGSDGSVNSVPSFTPPQLGAAGGVVFLPSHGNLPATATSEGGNGLNSPLMTTSTADAATNSAQNAHPESNVPRSTYIIDTDSGAKHTDQLTGQSKADVASDSSTTNSSFITGYTSASGSNKPTLPAENISSVSF